MKLFSAALLVTTMSILLAQGASPRREVIRAMPVPVETPVPTPRPTPEILAALPNYNEETATRLQIFLDNNNFGPGKIDGKMGEFFRKALISYKHAHGTRETGVVDSWMLDQVPVTFTTYTIAPDDEAKFVGPLPESHEEQAKLKWLPYTSCSSSSPNVIIPRRLTFRN